jgi:branched-chain amino acid transport system ATP-binding protein
MAVVGGLSSLSGALLGVAAVELLIFLIGQTTSQGAQFSGLGTGALMLGVLMAFPGGVGQAVERARDAIVRRLAARRGIQFAVGAAAGSLTPGATGATDGETHAPVTTTRAAAGQALLSCRDLTASYGPLQVLFGVDFEIQTGELVALLGTNGAGKSTIFRAVTNLLPPTGGTVELDGHTIRGLTTDAIARRGLAVMRGGRGVFPTLTVAENLRLACWQLRGDRAAADLARREALEMFPILHQRGDQLAGNLSGGEQQQLSLAMAFIPKPSLLLIDELSLGLAPTVVAMLCDKVARIHASGTTIVVVEQSVNVALQLAERAVFLEKGAVRFEGPTADLLDRPDMLRSVFLGDAATAAPGADDRADGEGGAVGERVPGTDGRRRYTDLVCHGVYKNFGGIRAIDDVHLQVEPGQIVGLIGHNGAGKTTLFDVISGFQRPERGRVLLGGKDLVDVAPHRRAVAGLGRSFQQARLYPSLTVWETIMVALDQHLSSRDWVAATLALPAAVDADRAASKRAAALIDLLGLGGYATTPIADLSTGTRRIVELACILAMDPAVILLDEPSAGVAQSETEALGPLLQRVKATTGSAMLIIEHDMVLLSSVCDELVAMELGHVICKGPPDSVLADPRVIESYLGTNEAAIRRTGRAATSPSVNGDSLTVATP